MKKKLKKKKGSIRNLFETVDTSLMGSINYGMSWDEIEKKVTKMFTRMRENGSIVTKKEFEKIKNQYYDLERDDISRIWGADYLKRAISQDPELSQYDVPDYVIVLDDLKTVTIYIKFDESWNVPAISTIRAGGSRPKIYFKSISGKNVTSQSTVLKKIGFNDFLGENVIEDATTKKRYIIDTETGSFAKKTFQNLANKDFIGLGEDCQRLYIKKLIYNEYQVDSSWESKFKDIDLDLSSINIASTAIIDTFAHALHALP